MNQLTPNRLFTLAFGLFLGLCVWKFGNPVILDHVISPPANFSDLLNDAWPTHWATIGVVPLALIGAGLVLREKPVWPASAWLWRLPLVWFAWQLIAAANTVDPTLTTATLWQFFGCLAGYFLGAMLFARANAWRWLLIGLFAAFTFCLVRAVDQKLYEFPANHQMLVEGERVGWTNLPPATVEEMKGQRIIIETNGVAVANPVILAKFAKGRVSGTLVYPNALAGIILLLWPLAFGLVFAETKKLKRMIRWAVIALTLFLGGAAFYWSGSKLGWLIGLVMVGVFLLQLDWPRTLKLATVAGVVVVGLTLFAVRFHNYFAAGATSVGARFDYWRAAVQTTAANPWTGTGPGTFQRPYARLKPAEAEMARLTHNDYLEQFSDSGVIGGLAYLSWIVLALLAAAKATRRAANAVLMTLLLGLLGWFLQGLGEFSLYVPALAWTAFTLLGCLIGLNSIEFDKKTPNR